MTVTLVKKLTAGVVLAVAIVGGSGSALAQKITKFDLPLAGMAKGQGTYAQQGLNSGTIVGYYVDADNVAHGFIRSVNGNYTTIDVPGAAGTQAFGINDKGTVVGWWFEAPAGNGSSVYHGYLFDKKGNFTYFDVPDAGPFFPPAPSSLIVIPLPLSINQSGTVTGSYFDKKMNLSHCFVRSVDGTITSFDPPGSVLGTTGDTNGINKEGAISGGYYDSNFVLHGFVRDPEGTITTFEGPHAGKMPGNGSVAEMINDAGTIPGVSFGDDGLNHAWIRYSDGTFVSFEVMDAGKAPGQGTLATAANVVGDTAGTYYDANGLSHGFVRSKQGKITTFDAPVEVTGPGPGVTATNSINAGGAVVGWYVDSNGAYHGYIYK